LREETILLIALALLALFLGLFIGGGFTYWYMPRRCSKIIETTSVEYQCYDGSKKSDIKDCPKPKIPKCENVSLNETTVVRLPFDCEDCLERCPQICRLGGGLGGVTTTTIHVPVLPPCTTDADCGEPSLSEIKCRYGKMERIKSEPFCDEGYCKARQSVISIRSCMEHERCEPGVGCVPREEEEEE
jgi:hypothetical protein